MKPTAFSHLDSVDGILRPVVGVGAINLTSPVFVDGRFPGKKAIQVPTIQGGEYVGLGNQLLNDRGGCLSTWFKPVGWSLSGTVVTGGAIHVLINTDYDVGAASMYCYAGNGEGLIFDFTSPALRIASTLSEIVDGVWHHLALKWESAGAKTMIIKLNDIEVASGASAINSFSNSSRLCDVGNFRSFPTQPWGDTIFQNFQFYNHPKSSFKDRNNPREGMPDHRIAI